MNINRDELVSIFRSVFPFYGLNPNQYKLLLNNCEVVYFPSEKMVYLEGTPAVYLYLIVEGQIEILKEKNRSLKQINVLDDHFAFGEDALKNNRKRQTGARAVTDVILIKINFEKISHIRVEDRDFNKNLNIMISTYEHLINKNFSTGPDETFFYIGQPHKITLILKWAISLITSFGIGILIIQLFNNQIISYANLQWGGCFIALICVLAVGWQFLEWKNDYFVFTNKRIINQQKAIFSFETKQETPIIAIKSVQARKSFLARTMDFGDLEIRTFTGSMRLSFISEIIYVERIIAYLIARLKEFQSMEEKRAFEKDVRERITMRSHKQQLEFSSNQESNLPELLNSDDHLDKQSENDGYDKKNDIIYHTHWTVLIMKIFIPSALLIAHILLYLFLVINQIAIINTSIFNIIIGINCLILFTWSVFRFVDWRNDVYIISRNQIIDYDRRPFGMEDKQTAPIKNIQSIRYRRNGFFGLLLNFGTVFIRIGDEEFTFNNVYRPADVQEKLFAAKDRFHRMKAEAEKRVQREKAVEWINSYHRVVTDLQEKEQHDEPKGSE